MKRRWLPPRWFIFLLWALIMAAVLATLEEWNGRRRESRRIEATRRLLVQHGIRSEPTDEPLIVRELHFYPELLPATSDLHPWLHANGITFHEGSYADYDPATGRLRSRNTQAQQDMIDGIVTDHFQFSRWEKAVWWIKSWLPGTTAPASWTPYSRAPTLAPDSPSTIPGLDPPSLGISRR